MKLPSFFSFSLGFFCNYSWVCVSFFSVFLFFFSVLCFASSWNFCTVAFRIYSLEGIRFIHLWFYLSFISPLLFFVTVTCFILSRNLRTAALKLHLFESIHLYSFGLLFCNYLFLYVSLKNSVLLFFFFFHIYGLLHLLTSLLSPWILQPKKDIQGRIFLLLL